MNEMTVDQLVKLLHGELSGDQPATVDVISGTCPIDNYRIGEVAYIANQKYLTSLNGLTGAVIILPESLAELAGDQSGNTFVIVEDVLAAMMGLQDYFYGPAHQFEQQGVSPTGTIGQNVELGQPKRGQPERCQHY